MQKTIVSMVLIAILVPVLVYLVLDKVTQRQHRELLEDEQKINTEEIQRLREETAELKETLKKEKEILELPPEKLADVFGEDTPSTEVAQELPDAEDTDVEIDCDSIDKRIVNFFSYLDRREYIKEYDLKDGTYVHFKNITTQLTEQVPVVGEKNSPLDILKNTYHFYRAIRKRNIILIKEITEKEKDVIEQTMDYLYMQQFRCESDEKFLPPFGALYEYAHFFLNSIGGKAYLFRLDSRMRILLFYYSTMIIHEANMREINKYGIDIRRHIKRLEDDLKNYSKFYYPDKYLHEIEMMKKKYPVPSPAIY